MRRSLFLAGCCLSILALPGAAFAQSKTRILGKDTVTNLDNSATVTNGKLDVNATFAGGGDASAANQTSVQAVAGSSASKAVAVQGISGGLALPVSAAALPLPTGAATSANQTSANTKLDTLHTDATAATPAGENHLGEVSGHATVAGGSFTRPGNVTAYVANSLYANSTTAGSVLPISAAVCRVNGGHGGVIAASLSISNPLAVTHAFRLHFFKGTTSSPFVTTTVGDGGAWSGATNLVAAIERATIDVTLTDKGSAGDGAKGWGNRNIGSTANAGGIVAYDCNTGVTNMYVMIETLDVYTPTNGETATVALEVVQD